MTTTREMMKEMFVEVTLLSCPFEPCDGRAAKALPVNGWPHAAMAVCRRNHKHKWQLVPSVLLATQSVDNKEDPQLTHKELSSGWRRFRGRQFSNEFITGQ